VLCSREGGDVARMMGRCKPGRDLVMQFKTSKVEVAHT
jgi:hypothetical protein